MSKLWAYAFFVQVVVLLIPVFRRGPKGEYGVLRWGWDAFLLSQCSFFSLAFLIFGAGLPSEADRGELIAAAFLLLIFGTMGVFFLLEGLSVCGVYDQEKIDFSTPWTGRKVAYWHALKSVSTNDWMGWVCLEFDNGLLIRLPQLLLGYDGVVAELNKRGHDLEYDA